MPTVLPPPTGIRLHVEERGTGPPLVLLHGFGATLRSWSYVADELAGAHRLILVDLKGHGRSPAPRDDRYSPLDHAAAVRDTLAVVDPGPATLVGNSLGGTVALVLALEGLDDPRGTVPVERLVLLSAAAYPQELPPFISLARLPLLPELFFRLVPARWIARASLRQAYHRDAPVREELVADYAGNMDDADGRYTTIRSARQLLPPGVEELVDRYREIRLPALLLWGREDPVIPLRYGERLAGDLPRASLSVIDGCGHVPQEERPGETARRILGFLGGGEG